jgi:hypothetical protein
MATVQSLYNLVGTLTARARVQLNERFVIPALNEARFEVWKVLTSFEAQQNWFLELDTGNTIAVGDLDIALPTTCGSLRKIEVASPASQTHVRFYRPAGGISDERFSALRADPNAKSSEIPYVIVGDEPGTLILGCSPPADVTVTLWIIAKPAEWTALSDNIDVFPRIAWMPMARYAAAMVMGGAGSQQIGALVGQLEADLIRMTQSAERDDTGPDVVQGWME